MSHLLAVGVVNWMHGTGQGTQGIQLLHMQTFSPSPHLLFSAWCFTTPCYPLYLKPQRAHALPVLWCGLAPAPLFSFPYKGSWDCHFLCSARSLAILSFRKYFLNLLVSPLTFFVCLWVDPFLFLYCHLNWIREGKGDKNIWTFFHV